MRDTGHLSLMERGAYDALLDHYYATAKPLPADPDTLFRITRAQGEAEESAVLRVAREFFTNGGGLLRNRRAEAELRKAEGRSKGGKARADRLSREELSEIGKRGAEARWSD